MNRIARALFSGPAPLALLLVAALASLGCRGSISRKPPIHPNPNMDDLPLFEAQEPNPRFADGRAMRPPVPGTVARGRLMADTHRWDGKLADGSWASSLPEGMVLDAEMLKHGRERYDIYCAPCHAVSGDGQGSAVQRGMLPPPTLHDARLRAEPIGYFYEVITNGVRNMKPYRNMIPVDDRWSIAAYVRVLQRSRDRGIEDIPSAIADAKGWSGS